jgi:prevent-host-death family protein
MVKVPEIIPVTDLRQDAAGVLKRLKKTQDPLVITQRGRATAVLLSLEAYERSRQEREILRLLARGENEIALGKGYSLDSVLKDADEMLEGERT